MTRLIQMILDMEAPLACCMEEGKICGCCATEEWDKGIHRDLNVLENHPDDCEWRLLVEEARRLKGEGGN